MWNFAFAFLLLIAAQAPSPKSVDWTWDRTTPGCALQQAYTADGRIISVSRVPGNDLTSISLTRQKQSFGSSITLPEGKVIFLPGGESAVEIHRSSAKSDADTFASSEDSNILEKFAKASELEIVHEKLPSVRVPVRSAAAAVQALRTCEDARMLEWGINPVSWRALKARPLPVDHRRNWITPDDYPVSAILEGVQGNVILRLDVGPDGAVQACTSLNSNRSARSRNRICEKLVLRARFKPALDGDGKPVAAPYVMMIAFRLA